MRAYGGFGLACGFRTAIFFGVNIDRGRRQMTARWMTRTLGGMILLAGMGVFSFTGCAPRGETRSLDEILSGAKSKYDSVEKELSPAVLTQVNSLTSNLERALEKGSGGELPAILREAGGSLQELTLKAGYTSRAALSEFSAQFQELARQTPGDITSAQVKLLAARAYQLLLSEIETTKFAL